MDGLIRKMEVPKKGQLEELDLFSEGVGFSFGGHDRSRTKSGALFTFIIVGCAAYLFNYYLTGALDTTAPKIQFDETIESTAISYNITNSDLKFFLFFDDPSVTVVTQEADYGDISSEDEDDEEEPNYDVSDTDEEERRRLLEGSTKRRSLQNDTAPKGDLFLDFENYKQWLHIDVSYVQTKSEIKNGKVRQVKKVFKVDMIPCKNASWTSDPLLAPFMESNKFATTTVKNNGYCVNLNESHNIFGNWLSQSDSAVIIDVFICSKINSTSCRTDSNDKYLGKGLSMHLGSFTSTVDNSNRDKPFVYDYYSHGSLHLSPQSRGLFEVTYKKVKVSTDVGTVFEDSQDVEVGVIDDVSTRLISNLKMSTVDGSVTYPTPAKLASIQVRGSSKTDVYKRSYDKLFDFIGNFGGAMEFVFLSATILSIYLEEALKERKLKLICNQELGINQLPKNLGKKPSEPQPKTFCGSLWFWITCKNKKESSLDTFTDEIIEKSLSFEQLLQNTLMTDLLTEHFVPKELLVVAPYYFTLQAAQKARKEEEEEEKRRLLKKNKVVNIREPIPKEEEEEEAPTFEQSLARLKSPEFDSEYPAFAALKKKYLDLEHQSNDQDTENQLSPCKEIASPLKTDRSLDYEHPSRMKVTELGRSSLDSPLKPLFKKTKRETIAAEHDRGL